MSTWSIHVADLKRDEALSLRRAAFVREIVEVTTSRVAGTEWRSAVRCDGDAAGTSCDGRVTVSLDPLGVIACSREVCN